MNSTPRYQEFIPLPHQYDVIYDIENTYDYNDKDGGTHEILMSGAVGSAKSMVGAHLIAKHVLEYPGAVMGIGRLALPHLKRTLCKKIKEHMYNLGAGLSFTYNETSGDFKFNNGSVIYAMSWKDGNFTKLGSYEYSSFVVEELSENRGKFEEAYRTITQRVGRLKIPQKFILSLTNPDSPKHWAYKYFIKGDSPNRHVYYSLTTDNIYLPDSYIRSLGHTLDPKMYRRMVGGEWLDIQDEVVYYQYSDDNRIHKKYTVNPHYPVIMACDFNIAANKPMSYAFLQNIGGITHIFGEVVVQGARTRQAVLEAAEQGLLSGSKRIIVHGDAAGWSGDTRTDSNDYEIISQTLNDLNLDFDIDVARSNPAVKVRHNIMNGRIKNAYGQVRLFVYDGAEVTDEGLRLTALKPGSKYIEDDTKAYQHITTAIGYSVCQDHQDSLRTPGETMSEVSRYA